jgi:hypothetical protein
MKNVLSIAAVLEAATGLGLVLAPALVGRLLLGMELSGAGIPVGRVLGIALLSLAVACGPGTPRAGMMIYSTAAALYLAMLGITGSATGILLWPAVVLHVLLSALLITASTKSSPPISRP